MITTKYVRDHIAEIRNSLKRRGSKFDLDGLLKLDEEWRDLKTRLQDRQARINRSSLEISEMKKKGEGTKEQIAALAKVKEEIAALQSEIPTYEYKINELLWNMPNIVDDSVPDGQDEHANVELRKWGAPRKGPAKSHEEILTKLGFLDVERAAKVSGARFVYLKGDLGVLQMALLRFAVDEMVNLGYTLVIPPFMLRKKYYKGATALADFEDALYRIGDPEEVRKEYEKIEDELFLISTAEHALAAMHADEVFSGKDLPLKYVGISPCFRREAGAHGKDTKGMFRVHQFFKVEQFIFSNQEDSKKYLDELISNEEMLFQKLKIPYHVWQMCTGDLGTVAAKKIDLEAWMPSQNAYREVTSASNCTEWQSMRLNIKYDDKNERKYVHTLNGTGIADTRTLVAIVENYVNGDGTITVPDALVPYMGKSQIG